jgi:hypothetical protein
VDGVEGVVGERELLRGGGLERHGQVATVIGAGWLVDHLGSGVHSVDRPRARRRWAKSKASRPVPEATSRAGCPGWSSSRSVTVALHWRPRRPPEPHPQITDAGLANQRVLILVISFLCDSPSVGMIRNLFFE